MTTHEERQRLAAMGNALRPDWNVRSLYTVLTDDEVLVKRSYRDVAKAAADCWTDPDTKTPKRLSEPGPWWGTTTTAIQRTPMVNVVTRCDQCGGMHAPNPTPGELCDPPEQARSNGRGAAAVRAALFGRRYNLDEPELEPGDDAPTELDGGE